MSEPRHRITTDTGRASLVYHWLFDIGLSSRAIHLYGLLDRYADWDADEATIGRKALAEKLGVSLDTLDRTVKELVAAGVIEVVPHSDARGRAENGYHLHSTAPMQRASRTDAAGGGRTDAATKTQTLFPQSETSGEVSIARKRESRDAVVTAWLSHEALIAHRETYFADDPIRRRIDKAVMQYGVADVVVAISFYAEVLASKAHFFDYRWTLKDFLDRGLSRFVPEAEPLKNFKSRATKQTGVQDNMDFLRAARTRTGAPAGPPGTVPQIGPVSSR